MRHTEIVSYVLVFTIKIIVKCAVLEGYGILRRDGGSKNLLNIGQFLPDYTAKHPGRESSSFSSTREPEISSFRS